MEAILNQYFPSVLTKIIAEDVYQYHETMRFDQVVAQINQYSFGIQHLPMFHHTNVRDFGMPHMLWATSSAFYKLLKNPEYETILTDINGFDDDKIFDSDTWLDVIDDLICSIANIGESFIDGLYNYHYVYNFDSRML